MKDRYNELTIATVYKIQKKEQRQYSPVQHKTILYNKRQRERKKWLNKWKLLNKQYNDQSLYKTRQNDRINEITEQMTEIILRRMKERTS